MRLIDYFKLGLPLLGIILGVWVRVEITLATHNVRMEILEGYKAESQASKDEAMILLYKMSQDIENIKKNQDRILETQ